MTHPIPTDEAGLSAEAVEARAMAYLAVQYKLPRADAENYVEHGRHAATQLHEILTTRLSAIKRERDEARTERDTLRSQLATLKSAGQRVLDGLIQRVEAADPRSVPVFDGIADLCASLASLDKAEAAAGAAVTLTYTNWRGETALRTIIPERIYFGSNDWHKEPQWLLDAWDVEKSAVRAFALSGFGERANAAPKSDAVAEVSNVQPNVVTSEEPAWQRAKVGDLVEWRDYDDDRHVSKVLEVDDDPGQRSHRLCVRWQGAHDTWIANKNVLRIVEPVEGPAWKRAKVGDRVEVRVGWGGGAKSAGVYRVVKTGDTINRSNMRLRLRVDDRDWWAENSHILRIVETAEELARKRARSTPEKGSE